jgi:hypothetical protein
MFSWSLVWGIREIIHAIKMCLKEKYTEMHLCKLCLYFSLPLEWYTKGDALLPLSLEGK